MATALYAHIDIEDGGVPIIRGTRTKVIEIALDHIAYRWDADEILRQHPSLSLGQIHSALAYYFDHKEEIDQQIGSQLENIERLRQQAGPSPVLARAQQSGGSS